MNKYNKKKARHEAVSCSIQVPEALSTTPVRMSQDSDLLLSSMNSVCHPQKCSKCCSLEVRRSGGAYYEGPCQGLKKCSVKLGKRISVGEESKHSKCAGWECPEFIPTIHSSLRSRLVDLRCLRKKSNVSWMSVLPSAVSFK